MSINIAFLGTPDFAVPSLEKIHKLFGVKIVFTRPSTKSNRGMKVANTPVYEKAKALGIEVRTPKNLSDDFDLFIEKKIDISVVVAYGEIISERFLKLENNLFLNIHASLLPKWRGAAPIQRSIMALDKETGISIMKIEKSLDSGPVLLKQSIPLNLDSKGGEVEKKLSTLGSEMILDAIKLIQSKKFKFETQKHEAATYAKKITKEDEKIDWKKNAKVILAQIHALNPKPGAFFEHKGEVFKILSAALSDKKHSVPGHIVDAQNLIIACGDVSLKVLEIQRSGKKIQSTSEFIKGYKLSGQI
jgi:methionyl-tRNA formyltransferase